MVLYRKVWNYTGAGRRQYIVFRPIFSKSFDFLTQLTNHQAEKLKELFRYLHEDVHLSAPAGAGKSFVAIRHAISKLSSSSQGKILFISPNRSLGFHFVRWLLAYRMQNHRYQRCPGTSSLQRLVLMHAPYDRFTGVQVEDSHIVLPELTVMPDDLVLAVFDEGHEIFRTNQSIFQEVRGQHKLIHFRCFAVLLTSKQLS